MQALRAAAAGAILAGGQLAAPHQVHSPDVVTVNAVWDDAAEGRPVADAVVTATPGVVLGIVTADCGPILFADAEAGVVGAAHAGWRGLAAGVLEATLDSLDVPADEVLVWLGPAIGPKAFEVGPEVREVFINQLPEAAEAFVPSNNAGKFMADIYLLARLRLAERGVTAVYGGGFCTVTDPRFFSYRRAPRTGRFASLIWLDR